MFMIIILIISFAKSQWVIANYFLTSQQIYQKSSYCYNYYTEYFCEATSYTTANFITCQQPQRSFITLNQSFKGIRQYSTYSFNSGYFISFDLYFGGKWVNDEVVFEVGSFQNKFSYTSPDIYPITQGFCDSLQTDVKTVNFTIPSYQSGQMKFSLSTKNAGSVSINMIITSRKSSIICYPSCSACIGPEQNQCLSCFYGVPANNKCPQCPNNLYYEKNSGCKINCKFENSKFSNGFCQAFDYYSLILFDYYIGEVSMLKWQQLYDPLHISTYPQYTYTGSNNYAYGIFRYNSGIGRYINEITASSSTSTYGYGLRIQLQLFDNLQLGTGIRFMINNTYYSSIYKDSQGIQTHRISIGSQSQYSFNSYMMTTLDLYMFVDMLQYPFYFSAIGNLTGSSGWGLMSLQFTKGLCPRNCQMCDVPYQCKKCYSGYFVNKDGNCIYSCSSFTQKVVGDYCQEYEDEIPYSKYLIKDFYDLANDQDQYPEYKLLSQEGVNFLKGEYIHYSTYNSIRIFGGQYVWSQAVFQRIHQISNKPHHRITISFRIVFGPNFPSDSRFIYTVDDNAPISNSRQGSSPFFIKNTFVHTQDELTVKWECYGVNNEPINAYCGFYNYFIVVHYCQPYCLQCTDQDTCLEWEQYDQVQIQLSQTECQSEQYYDKFELKCKSCPSSCLTCQSSYYCLTCKPTFILTKLGCVCQTNQYDEANQCMNCPQQCEQCLNSSFCVNCSFQKYRTLMNGQCVCLDGYYSIPTNPQCQRCHYFCKTCSGYSQCIECQNINNIEKVDSTCKCKAGTAYQDSLKTCAACHQTCLTCFKISISGCLTCNSVQKRVLRGLKCECQPGYYELNNICEDCPNLEDNQLSQCYNQCNNNQKVWHTTICSACDSDQELVQNNCQPKCGDNQLQLYEECEDGNNTLDDLCYNCQFQCPIHCLTCNEATTLPCPDICGDGIITGDEECEDGNTIQYDGCYNCKYQCQTACTKCILGKCYECSTLGWYTDTSNWKCKEQCGDGLIIGTEQCEDLNTTDTDGCHNCRFFCRKGCSSCNYTTGTCLSCEQPGYEPYQYYCRNICGDGLIVDGLYGFYPEYCDDGNTDNSNYCNSSCEACAVGYTRSNVKICQPICGDSRKVVGEICETGLILPYKGCQSCKPKCQSICENCDTNGKGCLQCQLGYVNLNNVCHSICGDLIVTEAEECDDGNLIYGDGCHFCRFSCVKLCLSCINGVCYLYENDEDYDLSISKCLSVIGLNMKIDQQACLLFSDLIYFSRSYVKNIFQCHHKCQVCKFQTCYLCQQGYELTPNKQECRQSSILLDELKYCQISIGNFCYVCYDYAYFDIFENRCKLPSYSFQLIQQQCNQGYQLDDNGICVSSCGDGILTEEEECETQDENCLYCIYQQPYRCNYFFKDLCLECELGYQYDLMKKSCQVWREYKQIVMNEEEYNYLICQVELSGNCLKCEQGMCLECKQHSLFINGLCKEIQTPSELEIFNAEFDQDQHESLEQNEQQQQQLCDLNCNKCLNGFCEQCKNGFILNSIIQLCQASDFIQYVKIYDENTILDSVFNVNEHRCELLNNQIFVDDKFYVYDESCQRLRVNQQQSEEQIEQDSKTDNYEPCDQNCLFCNLGICSLCLKGSYIFNYECLQNGVVEYSQKEQVCGDKIVQIGEVCDDGNEFQYDGCFQCQFSCDENCSKCEYGICLICQIGFILDSTICKPFCGDGLAIPYKEECDDFNDSQGDGCDQCKFECVHNCLKCNQVHCYKCEKGYTNENDICVAKCGDSIVIPEYEQCDDGNKIMYDGCFNCQYQCSQNCLECYQGICTFACPDDKIVVDGICLQQCGKLIVSYNKECDDGNEIEYDGCFECKFQCINNCHSDFCKQGICTKCISGYFLYIQQCNISEMEENFESMLGNQQSSWICKDSECVFSESPKLALKSVGLQKEKYKLLIQFDQEVRCAFTECQDIFNIYFQEISEDQYNVQCSPFENQGFKNQDQVVWVEYLIEIEVFNPIKFSPTLIVILQQEILNQNQQNITTINYKLKLDKAIILEQNQKQTTAQMQLTSKAVVIASISLGALSLISGESTFVMELLNIIQYQSFLKFVNQEYPENLLIYFQASEMISVGPYLQVFNVDQLIEPILKKDEFIQLNGKFLYYELEPSIIINICPQIFQAFGIVLVMFSGKVLNILFVYIMSNQWLTSTLSNKNKLYSIIICKILKTIRKGIKLLQIQKYYFGLKQIKLLLLLNSWDLLFKSVLYLNSKKDETLRNIIESTMSLVIITTYFAVLIDCFQSCRPNKLISKAQRFDQIFVTLELCRTILFSVVLILFQSNQVLQTLLLYIGSFSQCFFIYKYKQVDQFGKILSILIEGSVSIFILTSIIYFKAFREYINPDIMTTVGFAHIGILLISSIILGVKQTIFTIKLFIKKFMKTKEN